FDRRGSMCGTCSPRTLIVPASGVTAPVITLMSVDLPAPFSPITAWTSPARSSNETDLSAFTPANAFEIELASRTRSPIAAQRGHRTATVRERIDAINCAIVIIQKMRIKQSLTYWCLNATSWKWDIDRICQTAKSLGCQSVELVPPEFWLKVQSYGLKI